MYFLRKTKRNKSRKKEEIKMIIVKGCSERK